MRENNILVCAFKVVVGSPILVKEAKNLLFCDTNFNTCI